MKITIFTAIGILFSSCVTHPFEEDSIYVRTSGMEVDTTKPISFHLTRQENEDIDSYADRQKVMYSCKFEAKIRGIELMPDNFNCLDCYKIIVGTDVSSKSITTTTSDKFYPSDTTCFNNSLINGVTCHSSAAVYEKGQSFEQRFYMKAGLFRIYDPKHQLNEAIRKVDAIYKSDNKIVSGKTAEYFCRGFFAGYSKDVAESFTLPERQFSENSKMRLGIFVDDAESNTGLAVNSVTEGSVAERAGINPGDRITKIDSIKINSYQQLLGILSTLKPSDKISIETCNRSGCKDHNVDFETIAH